MRRLLQRGVRLALLVPMAVAVSACGEVNPTEQSLARTATAFFGPTRAPSAVSSANRPTAIPTPRAPVSVVALATPTPLPPFSPSTPTARISSVVTQPIATPTRVPVPTAVQVVTVTADDNVNLRDAPAADANVVTQLRPGAEITVVQTNVMGQDGGDIPWVKVSAGGQTGYVRSDLVSPPHTAALAPTRTPASSP